MIAGIAFDHVHEGKGRTLVDTLAKVGGNLDRDAVGRPLGLANCRAGAVEVVQSPGGPIHVEFERCEVGPNDTTVNGSADAISTVSKSDRAAGGLPSDWLTKPWAEIALT